MALIVALSDSAACEALKYDLSMLLGCGWVEGFDAYSVRQRLNAYGAALIVTNNARAVEYFARSGNKPLAKYGDTVVAVEHKGGKFIVAREMMELIFSDECRARWSIMRLFVEGREVGGKPSDRITKNRNIKTLFLSKSDKEPTLVTAEWVSDNQGNKMILVDRCDVMLEEEFNSRYMPATYPCHGGAPGSPVKRAP